MFNKKIFIALVMCAIIVISGFLIVNSVNTKALSPIGNSEDNYAMVSEEFGDDFKEFIRDEAPIKVYTAEKGIGDETIKILDKEIRIRTDNPILNVILDVSSNTMKGFDVLKQKIYDKLENTNKNINKDKNNNIEDNNSENISDDTANEELDKIIDDFIKENNNN